MLAFEQLRQRVINSSLTPFSLSVRRILNHIGEPAQPPRIAPARGPPAREAEAEALQLADPIAQPEPDFQFDQTVSW